MGFPWWSRGEDSVLPLQGARVGSLVGEKKRLSEARLRSAGLAHTSILSTTLPLNYCYETIAIAPNPPRVGITVFKGKSPTVSAFAWQSNKAILFYFMQNPASKI